MNQKKIRSEACKRGIALLGLCAAMGAGLMAAESKPALKTPTTSGPEQVECRGRVVCLAEEMHRLHDTALSARHEHLYGFKTEEGKYYTLLRTKYSEALFADERVRAKELLLKGRLFPNTQILDAITLRSVHDGKVYDLVYYCEICEINAVAPGLCECCREPTELVERIVPASDK